MNLKWKIAQAAEAKWWANYLKNKDKAEYYEWKRDYWNDFISNLKTTLPPVGSKILDAGCGPAGIFTILDNHKVTAVDPLLDKYAENLKQFDINDYNHVNFQSIALERLSQTHRFDMIFCLNAINHVNNIQSTLSNLFNVANPGSPLILSTDAHNNDFLKGLFQIVPGDILHPHQYNIADYQNFVNNAGFQIRTTTKIKTERIFSYWVIEAYKPH